MADSAVPITAGAGTNIDTRTEDVNGQHRQVVVLGDPTANVGVAPVTAADGLSVKITNASLTVGSHAVTNAGTFAVQNTPVRPGTAVLTNVPSSATSVTIQAANANRRGLIVFNDSTQILRLKYGATASATSFTHLLQAGEERTLMDGYTGIVDGIWESANGNARVTELT